MFTKSVPLKCQASDPEQIPGVKYPYWENHGIIVNSYK